MQPFHFSTLCPQCLTGLRVQVTSEGNVRVKASPGTSPPLESSSTCSGDSANRAARYGERQQGLEDSVQEPSEAQMDSMLQEALEDAAEPSSSQIALMLDEAMESSQEQVQGTELEASQADSEATLVPGPPLQPPEPLEDGTQVQIGDGVEEEPPLKVQRVNQKTKRT